MDCSEDAVIDIINQMLPLEYMEDIVKNSLDTDLNNEDNLDVGLILANICRESIVDEEVAYREVFNNMCAEEIHKALETLKPREQETIELRFGLNGGEPHTLEEVGNIFGVTRERIRQIEAKAIRKLRHPSRGNKFKVYYY